MDNKVRRNDIKSRNTTNDKKISIQQTNGLPFNLQPPTNTSQENPITSTPTVSSCSMSSLLNISSIPRAGSSSNIRLEQYKSEKEATEDKAEMLEAYQAIGCVLNSKIQTTRNNDTEGIDAEIEKLDVEIAKKKKQLYKVIIMMKMNSLLKKYQAIEDALNKTFQDTFRGSTINCDSQQKLLAVQEEMEKLKNQLYFQNIVKLSPNIVDQLKESIRQLVRTLSDRTTSETETTISSCSSILTELKDIIVESNSLIEINHFIDSEVRDLTVHEESLKITLDLLSKLIL